MHWEKKTQMWHDVAITYIVTPKKKIEIDNLVGGIPTPLKNDGVSWDDEIHVPNHQPVTIVSEGYNGL